MIRTQAYIDAHPDLHRKQHHVSDLTQYLNALGRKTGFKDWQCRQTVDAMRILLVEMAGLDWARDFDWDGWRESARSLPSSHPTVARDDDHVLWQGIKWNEVLVLLSVDKLLTQVGLL